MNQVAEHDSRMRPIRQGSAILLRTEECFFARLDGLPRRPSESQLRFAFEPWLPCPLDTIEARFTTLEQTNLYVACGVDRGLLASLIEDTEQIHGPLESIIPESVPAWVHEGNREPLPCAAFEYRSGTFESPRSRLRRRIHRAVQALVLAGAFLLAFYGIWQRTTNAVRGENAAQQAAIQLVESVIGPGPSGVDPLHRLQSYIAQVRDRTALISAASQPPIATSRYVSLLSAWPQDLVSETNSLRITEDSIQVRSTLRDLRDHERLLAELGSRLAGCSVSSSSGVPTGASAVRSTIVLRCGEGADQ